MGYRRVVGTRRRLRPLIFGLALASSLSVALLVLLVPAAQGAPGADDAGTDAGRTRINFFAGDAGPKAPSTVSKIPPDPPPMRAQAKWLFDLRYDRGEPHLVSARRVELSQPEESARVFGRFAIELFEGPTLIERVRFDFPLLAVPDADGGFMAPPKIEPKLRTRIGVFFPVTPRGTRLQLWDRATDRRWDLPWPPQVSADGGIADGGPLASP